MKLRRVPIAAFVIVAVLATLSTADAAPSFRAGDLTFAGWTRRLGVVGHGNGRPPGPWAVFGPQVNAAVASVPQEHLFISCSMEAGDSSNTDSSNTWPIVKALDPDTGSVKWSFNATLNSTFDDFAFAKSMQLTDSGIAPATFAVIVASVSGVVVVLEASTGIMMSTVALPSDLATAAAFVGGGSGAQPGPLPPFQSFLSAGSVATATVMSADARTVFVIRVAAGGSSIRLAASLTCNATISGAKTKIQNVVTRGGSKVVVQCLSHVFEFDAETTTRRSIDSSVSAVATIEHSASWVDGAPALGSVVKSAKSQDVFFAGFSSLRNAVVVGTVDFATGSLVECATLHTAKQIAVQAIRVVATGIGTAAPSPKALLIQTFTGITAFDIMPLASPTSACRWAVGWEATYDEIVITGAAVQGRPQSASLDYADVGVVTVLPTPSFSRNGATVLNTNTTNTTLLVALRIGASFYVIDASQNRRVVWAETADAATKCYASTEVTINPLLAGVNPALDTIVLGCPNVYYVLKLPDIAAYAAGAFNDTLPVGSLPPFATLSGHIDSLPLIAAPFLFSDTLVSMTTGQTIPSYIAGTSFDVRSSLADGALFTMNSDPDSPRVVSVTAVGAGGQLLWHRGGFVAPVSVATGAVLQPFGPYLLVATNGWTLFILNASSGVTVRREPMPYACSAGEGEHFAKLAFDGIVLLNPAFDEMTMSGLPFDATTATLVIFSFGVCEYTLDASLTLRQFHRGLQSNNYPFRAQVNGTHVVTISKINTLRLYDFTDVQNPKVVWTAQPSVLEKLFFRQKPSVHLSGNALVVATSLSLSVLLVDTGATVWVDTHLSRPEFFIPASVGVYGDTIVITTSDSVAGYHVAVQPIANHSAPHSSTAPQQVKWHRFEQAFSSGPGTGRLSQYGHYIVAQRSWVAALVPGTGATAWRNSDLPPTSAYPYPGRIYDVSSLSVSQNIVTFVWQSDRDLLWMLDAVTGAFLQVTLANTLTPLTFLGDRIVTGAPPGMTSVLSWPSIVQNQRTLPVPPRPQPFPPTTPLALPPHYERPTFAPMRAPIPELPVGVNATSAPVVAWTVPFNTLPHAVVFAPAQIIIQFNLNQRILTAHSLHNANVLVWLVSVTNCGIPQGLDIATKEAVVVATCEGFVSGFSAWIGATLWSYDLGAPSTPFRASVVEASSPKFGPGGSLNKRAVAIVVRGQSGASSIATGIDVVWGNVSWQSEEFACAAAHGPAPAILGATDPAASGESSQRAPPNVITCRNGDHVFVSPRDGGVVRAGPVVAVSVRHRLAAGIDPTGAYAAMIDVSTAVDMNTVSLIPALEYTETQSAPVGVNMVAADRRREAAVLLGVTGNQSNINAYVYDPASVTLTFVWSVSASSVSNASGVSGPELVFNALSQPELEEAGNTVLVALQPRQAGVSVKPNVYARLSLATGSILAASSFDNLEASSGGKSGAFAVFTPSKLDPQSPHADKYMVMTASYTTLLDIATLQPVYVNNAYRYPYGVGMLTVLASLFNDGTNPIDAAATKSEDEGDAVAYHTALAFIAPAQHTDRFIGRWPLSAQSRSFKSVESIPVCTVDDESGDLILIRSTVDVFGNSRPFLVRRKLFGPATGEAVWQSLLPPSLDNGDGPVVTINLGVSDTAVVFFTVEGVSFYDFVTGNVTTFVSRETLSLGCPMSNHALRNVFTVDPNGSPIDVHVRTSPGQFARPASTQAVLVLQAGACAFMFNTRRELATYRVPHFAEIAFENSFAAYVPSMGAPSIITVFTGVAEKWTLPVGFMTPTPTGQDPMPIVDYSSAAHVSLAWTVNLHTTGPGSSATTVVGSDTVFIHDRSMTAAVDLRRGVLLWRFTEHVSGNSGLESPPLHLYNGYLFFIGAPPTDSTPSLFLVVLDAFTLKHSDRVARVVALGQKSATQLITIVSDRIVVFQSGPRIVGMDVVSLKYVWNVAGPSSVSQSRIVPIASTTRDSPLFGAFVAYSFASTAQAIVYDGVSGAEIVTVEPTGRFETVLASSCRGSGAAQRCAVIIGDKTESDVARTFISVLPSTAVVPNKLPAPTGPIPTSPPVPADYRFMLPTPMNLPPKPLVRTAYPPILVRRAQTTNIDYVFSGLGHLYFIDRQEIVAVDVDHGTVAWSTPFNTTLQNYRQFAIVMATDSKYVVVTWRVNDDLFITILYDAVTGAQVLEVETDVEIRYPQHVGAVLGDTACHTFHNYTTGIEGIVCYDVVTARVSFHHCPAPAYVFDVRPNTAKTAMVFSCAGTASFGIDVRETSPSKAHLWSVVSSAPVGQSPPTMGGWMPGDPRSPTVGSAVVVAAKPSHANSGSDSSNVDGTMYDVMSIDTDTGVVHSWTLDLTALLLGGLGTVTSLSVRYVAVQSINAELVLDMFARTVALTRYYNPADYSRDTVICCPYLLNFECCGALRLLEDGTLLSVNERRETVKSYDLRRNSTMWESAPFLSIGGGHRFAVTDAVVFNQSRSIIVNNEQLFSVSLSNGEEVWSAQGASAITLAPACVWTGLECLGYVPPPAIAAVKNRLVTVRPITNGLIATDQVNLYLLDLAGSSSQHPAVDRYVTPSYSGLGEDLVLFGGADNDRFVVAKVNGRYWVFDTRSDLDVVFAFDFPLDSVSLSEPRPQHALLSFAVGVADAHGGLVFIPGHTSGVLAVIASISAPDSKPTFSMKFWQNGEAATAALTVFHNASAAGIPGAPRHRTCGVVVPIGGGVTVLDCVRVTPWWSSPTPTATQSYPAAVTGDYVVYVAVNRLVYASVITGQTVWRSEPLLPQILHQPVVWNHTVFVAAGNAGVKSVFGFDLTFDAAMAPEMSKSPTFKIGGFQAQEQLIFTPGVLVASDVAVIGYSLTTAEQLWVSDLQGNNNGNDAPFAVINGSLLIDLGGELYRADLALGNSTVIQDTAFGGLLTAIPGRPEIGVTLQSGPGISVVPVTAAAPLPPPMRTPAFGLPPLSYPAASPTSTPVPTLPPGAVVPSLGCVSRVVGAGQDFVTCADRVAAEAYSTAQWRPSGTPIFAACRSIGQQLKDCAVTYLSALGFECSTGVAHLETIFGRLNATMLFGECPAASSGVEGNQCTSGVRDLCSVMNGEFIVPGVGTLPPGEYLAPGFVFPPLPPFASAPPAPAPPATPQPTAQPTPEPTPMPTPAPVYTGLTTTFVLRFAPLVQPPSASLLAMRLHTYLKFGAEDPIDAVILSVVGSLQDGQSVIFNVTSMNAQMVAGELGQRSETSNAHALGAIQFGLWLVPSTPPATPTPETAQPTPEPTPMPTPAPVYTGLTTTFALRFAPLVQPPSAALLAMRLHTYLKFGAEDPIDAVILSVVGSLQDGQSVIFNVTSVNAQMVAGALGQRSEASNAHALGAIQFGLSLPGTPPPTSTPQPTTQHTEAPASTSDEGISVKIVAVVAVGAAVVSAAVGAVVMWAVLRRRSDTRGSMDALAGGVMSHRELKSLEAGMLGDSPYEEA